MHRSYKDADRNRNSVHHETKYLWCWQFSTSFCTWHQKHWKCVTCNASINKWPESVTTIWRYASILTSPVSFWQPFHTHLHLVWYNQNEHAYIKIHPRLSSFSYNHLDWDLSTFVEGGDLFVCLHTDDGAAEVGSVFRSHLFSLLYGEKPVAHSTWASCIWTNSHPYVTPMLI